MSVTCGSSMVFSGYSGFLHQWNWLPWYIWNIIETKPNQTIAYRDIHLTDEWALALSISHELEKNYEWALALSISHGLEKNDEWALALSISHGLEKKWWVGVGFADIAWVRQKWETVIQHLQNESKIIE